MNGQAPVIWVPIEQLPEDVTVLFQVVDQQWYGYAIGDQIYRFTGEPYTGIIQPYEFKRLTEYEEQNLWRISKHEIVRK